MGDPLIYQVDDQFVVSYNECWVEGVYSTPEAARMAVHCDPSKLHELWISVRPAAITSDMLRKIMKLMGGLTMTKMFEVGDKVRCHKWEGEAVITYISNVHVSGIGEMFFDDYVITVEPEQDVQFYFTIEGKLERNDAEPTLRHAETGKAAVIGEPPERFEYPLYRRSRESGAVVEFDSLTTGTVLDRGTSTYYFVTEPITDTPHTDAMWEPCEKPKWEPSKPTWCWVWGLGDYAKRLRLIVHKGSTSYLDTANDAWANAEPCKEEELPNYWPKEWV